MKIIEEVGSCPNCGCSLKMFKTSNYKRFVKCEVCEMSYALPKRGSISSSALICPQTNIPVLIIEKPNQKAYFWVDRPCFDCIKCDKCTVVKDLIDEFTALEVYGYG